MQLSRSNNTSKKKRKKKKGNNVSMNIYTFIYETYENKHAFTHINKQKYKRIYNNKSDIPLLFRSFINLFGSALYLFA